ncbi:hypothetical protein [Brucella sp. 22210]|uniref:hypothetical protein n=1 Tax=Brucella sp. 22210 TaxID=3453892 RepID=UPI003F845D21
MKKALLALFVVMIAAPACAGSPEDDTRQREKEFFNFARPQVTTDNEGGVTSKGCKWTNIPKWFHEKYKDRNGIFVLEDIQNTFIGNNIISQNTCTCETLYPAWDEAIKIYENEFKDLKFYAPYGSETNVFLRKYSSKSQSLIMRAREICKTAGIF